MNSVPERDWMISAGFWDLYLDCLSAGLITKGLAIIREHE